MARRFVSTIQVRDRNTGCRPVTGVRYNPSRETPECFASFFDTENVRIIRLLQSETNITVMIDDALSAPFHAIVGTPQGDSQSPVLFIVYLDAALRTLRGCLPRRPPADINLHSEAIYADDTDFISTDHEYLSKVNEIAPAALGDWFLYVNAQTSNVKSTVLQKNLARQRNLDPCSETMRTCLAEICLRLPLSVSYGPFGCEDNTSAIACDCVYITHSCGQRSYTKLARGA